MISAIMSSGEKVVDTCESDNSPITIVHIIIKLLQKFWQNVWSWKNCVPNGMRRRIVKLGKL